VLINFVVYVPNLKEREREREFICHKITKKTYKIILNISTVAGYQIGKPIKLVAYSELQVLKVGRFSVGWFMLAARLVRARLDFCTSWGQTK